MKSFLPIISLVLLTLTATSIFVASASSSSSTTTDKIYNVLNYGAIGDGKTLNTKAILSAIQAVKENNGGTLLFPSILMPHGI